MRFVASTFMSDHFFFITERVRPSELAAFTASVTCCQPIAFLGFVMPTRCSPYSSLALPPQQVAYFNVTLVKMALFSLFFQTIYRYLWVLKGWGKKLTCVRQILSSLGFIVIILIYWSLIKRPSWELVSPNSEPYLSLGIFGCALDPAWRVGMSWLSLSGGGLITSSHTPTSM